MAGDGPILAVLSKHCFVPHAISQLVDCSAGLCPSQELIIILVLLSCEYNSIFIMLVVWSKRCACLCLLAKLSLSMFKECKLLTVTFAAKLRQHATLFQVQQSTIRQHGKRCLLDITAICSDPRDYRRAGAAFWQGFLRSLEVGHKPKLDWALAFP